MQVRKRNGSLEDVNLEKITNSVSRSCEGLEGVDYAKVAYRTVGGLYDGVSTRELDELSIQTAVGFIAEDPIYSKAAARLLSNYINKEVGSQEIYSFSQSIATGYENGLIGEQTYEFVMTNKRKLNALIDDSRNHLFDFYGLRIVYDRYLLKHPTSRKVIETPQYFFMRVACGLSDEVKDAFELYSMLSNLDCMASTPTLFNSGTAHSQMSSCFLLDSPLDDLQDIEKRKKDIALLSKWAGGIGLNYSRVRGSGALIKGTNGISNGVVSFLHSLSANVGTVNQGGKRKGAACVYLETHHPDILEFLELKDNTGDQEKRGYNLNLANWIPDLFMHRVREDGNWSLFDPTVAPELTDLYGDAYTARYLELEEQKLYKKQVSARVIYHRMMRTLAETGNGWMTFKDTSNRRCNTAYGGGIVHSSNLCLAPDTLITAKVDDDDMLIEISLLCDFKHGGKKCEVMSFNEETKTFEWKAVVQAGLTHEWAELLEVQLPNGDIIECTENHPFLTQRGWVNAANLTEEDELISYEATSVDVLQNWGIKLAIAKQSVDLHLYAL